MSLTGLFFPVLMILLGLAMVTRAVADGAGPLALGVIIGILFVLAGAGRLYVERRTP